MPSFTILPLELRLEIYKLVFATNPVAIEPQTNQYCQVACDKTNTRPTTSVALLLVDHKTCAEALPLFYKYVLFVVRFVPYTLFNTLHKPDAEFSRIQRLRIEILQRDADLSTSYKSLRFFAFTLLRLELLGRKLTKCQTKLQELQIYLPNDKYGIPLGSQTLSYLQGNVKMVQIEVGERILDATRLPTGKARSFGEYLCYHLHRDSSNGDVTEEEDSLTVMVMKQIQRLLHLNMEDERGML
ncbi:hypothetical protein MMC20_003242 [Loxospora ochrophaea]|nr:hypothetical protein [Loxospora ochrophaea]